ncbi:MAG: hypothetical protein AAGN35_27840 [Bacteroidota bacterium]
MRRHTILLLNFNSPRRTHYGAGLMVLLLGLAQFGWAQSGDPMIQKLIDAKLLKKNQAARYAALLSDREDRPPAVYLRGLAQMEWQKIVGSEEVASYIYISFPDRLTARERKKLNRKLVQTVSGLQAARLISEKELHFQREEIAQNRYPHPLVLLNRIGERLDEQAHLAPERVMVFAEKLRRLGVSSGAKYEGLKSAIAEGALSRSVELVAHCDRAVLIDLNQYSLRPADYLEEVHQKTAGVLPELAFADFSFEVVLDSVNSYGNWQSYDCRVTLTVKGKTYRHRSFYSSHPKEVKEATDFKIDSQEYYQIFNQVLADQQSALRLHLVKAHRGNARDWNTYGIIALTAAQADSLHYRTYFDLSYENFKNPLTSARIQSAIEAYREIGLLDHLTPEKIAECRKRASETTHEDLNQVLEAFPDVIHSFDLEMSNLTDPYAEVIRACAAISHGDFQPTGTEDDFADEKLNTVTVRFALNRKMYFKALEKMGDWFDGQFFGFLDEVVADNPLPGRFYSLYEGGQGARIIYLTPQQYRFLKSENLLVFAQPGGDGN